MRRGRPRKANARRRATTVAGRQAAPDKGTRELRRKKRLATGREDLEIDGAAVLFAHGHLDRAEYDAIGLITGWLRLSTRAWGGRDGSCGGLWDAILGAATGASGARIVVVPRGAERAWRRFAGLLQRLNGSCDLVLDLAEGRIPPLCLRALEGGFTIDDRAQLAGLRSALREIR